MPYSVEHELGVMCRKNTADAGHSHEVYEHLDAGVPANFVLYFIDLVDLTRREIKAYSGTKTNDLFVWQRTGADRLAFAPHFFEHSYGLKKFKRKWLLE